MVPRTATDASLNVLATHSKHLEGVSFHSNPNITPSELIRMFSAETSAGVQTVTKKCHWLRFMYFGSCGVPIKSNLGSCILRKQARRGEGGS